MSRTMQAQTSITSTMARKIYGRQPDVRNRGRRVRQLAGRHGPYGRDFDNDGLFDIFVTTFIDQPKTLYHNQGSNLLDRTTAVGLGKVAFHYSGWGTKFFDFDNDGWLDLFFTNGHTMEQLEKPFPADPFAEPSYMMRNIEGKEFKDVSEAVASVKFRTKLDEEPPLVISTMMGTLIFWSSTKTTFQPCGAMTAETQITGSFCGLRV